MQARKIQPLSRGGSVADPIRRTASGESTASRESSIAQDSTYETDTTRFQPLLSRPQSQLSQTHYSNTSFEQYPSADAGGLASLHRFNASQGSSIDPHLHPAQVQAQYGMLTGVQHASIYNQDTGVPDPGYGPIDQDTRTGTPQLALGGTDAEKKDKKSATTTAANEKELRELLEKNEHRNLDSIARDVRQAERTQKSERAKQLFAMRWLREFCKQDTESVPRSRVYTHYAQRCGTDRVDTLNPASFGKLVRIIFPGIQTRRLGMRGESKYHYVNLRLLDDPQAVLGRPTSPQITTGLRERAGSYDPEVVFKTSSRLPADTATFASQETVADHPPVSPARNLKSRGLLFANPSQSGYRRDGEEPQMYLQILKFSASVEQAGQDEAMTLPSIYHFLPPGTDHDLADALTALYRTHCTSLVDAVRYVKQKSFFRLLGSFNGTLTVPVAKLFAHYALASWIKLCDWFMYQQIVRFLSQLTLQVIPAQVFMMLKEVANVLTDTLRKNFQHYPSHVLQAKLEPATIFSSLLQRLLRVNEAAHAAATFLVNDQVRTMMWRDWTQHVRPKRVLETELPSCGYEEAYRIMTVEMRQLLEPIDRAQLPDGGPDFKSNTFVGFEDERLTFATQATAEGILERWARFLEVLPGRFSQAQTRTLIHTINAVGTAALRDITVNQAQSFGSWWITKVWVDEMMLWQAEMGGFLESRPVHAAGADSPRNPEYQSGFGASRSSSGNSVEEGRSGGLGIDFQRLPNFAPAQQTGRQSTGPPTATFSFPMKRHVKLNEMNPQPDGHDDSGIGMSLLSNDADGVVFDFGIPSHELALT